MTIPYDNGYISDYLIHWTGKNGDDKGAEILSIIASECQLLLSYNILHIFDIHHNVHERMVCFTDVPLYHSQQHCQRYGRFGIAFHKLKLMNVGVQPVFYASHACKRDMNVIYKFLADQATNTTIDSRLFDALNRHFYLIQRLSDGKADSKDTFYYEREWRIGEQMLVPPDKLDRPNAKYQYQQEGYPYHTGRLAEKDGGKFFDFKIEMNEYVAFLIAPRDWQDKILNPHQFPLYTYEDLINDTHK
ncbi:MAG: abortive infection system antitoxin AbiGi family protein [Candidatus Methylumidiphilus sp.]